MEDATAELARIVRDVLGIFGFSCDSSSILDDLLICDWRPQTFSFTQREGVDESRNSLPSFAAFETNRHIE